MSMTFDSLLTDDLYPAPRSLSQSISYILMVGGASDATVGVDRQRGPYRSVMKSRDNLKQSGMYMARHGGLSYRRNFNHDGNLFDSSTESWDFFGGATRVCAPVRPFAPYHFFSIIMASRFGFLCSSIYSSIYWHPCHYP